MVKLCWTVLYGKNVLLFGKQTYSKDSHSIIFCVGFRFSWGSSFERSGYVCQCCEANKRLCWVGLLFEPTTLNQNRKLSKHRGRTSGSGTLRDTKTERHPWFVEDRTFWPFLAWLVFAKKHVFWGKKQLFCFGEKRVFLVFPPLGETCIFEWALSQCQAASKHANNCNSRGRKGCRPECKCGNHSLSSSDEVSTWLAFRDRCKKRQPEGLPDR